MHTVTIAAVFLAAMICRAGDSRYVGTWQLDSAKSDFGTVKIEFKETPSGDVEFVKSGGSSYRFKLDGRTYRNEYGEGVKWKSVSANTWKETVNPDRKGKDGFGIATFTLSEDGRAMTWVVKGTMRGGVPLDLIIVFNRVGTGNGFSGQWEGKLPKANESEILEISAWGDKGLLIKGTEKMKVGCKARFDGAEYPCEGPDYPPNTTMSLVERDPRAFESVIKVGGKVLVKRVITVSPTGDALTVEKTKGTGQKLTLVYEPKR